MSRIGVASTLCAAIGRPFSGRFAVVTLAALIAATGSVAAAKPKRIPRPAVRMVYLVPADRVVSEDYHDRLAAAIRHLRIWYHNEVADGTTFSLHKPVVEVVHTSQAAAWYSTNPAGDPAVWFFNNVVTDAFALTGARFSDPNNTWSSTSTAIRRAGSSLVGRLVWPCCLQMTCGDWPVSRTSRLARATHPTRRVCADGSADWATSWATRSASHILPAARTRIPRPSARTMP